MQPNDLKKILSSGLLSFPITDFDAEGNFRKSTYIERLEGWHRTARPRCSPPAAPASSSR